MNKLSKIITELNYEELKLIKKDLDEGNIKELIEQKIYDIENKKETICPVCHTTIIDIDNETLTLQFGPKGFRKKATFCATDCLEYFLTHLKTIKQEKIKKTITQGEHYAFI